MLCVALFSCAPESDALTENFLTEMLSLSNSSIQFYRCGKEETLREDVISGKAACGYILPEDPNQAIESYIADGTPFVRAIRAKHANNISLKIVDEIVLGKLYQPFSYSFLKNFLTQKTGEEPDEEELQNFYTANCSKELLFTFEYADKSSNAILNSETANYMLLPIRGIVSVLVLIACMSGGILWYSDQKSRLSALMDPKKRRLCSLLSLTLPAAFAAITGLFTIKITGIAERMLTEIPAMFFLFLGCCCLTHLLCHVFSKAEYFLAAIPVLAISSLLLCPVFISVSSFLPWTAPVSRLLPSSYYLTGLHDPSMPGQMLLYCAICLLLAALPNIRSRLALILSRAR